jgi:hypothetical protein
VCGLKIQNQRVRAVCLCVFYYLGLCWSEVTSRSIVVVVVIIIIIIIIIRG